MHAELFNQAVMHHHAGAFGDAERCYRQLLAVLPANAEAHTRLGAVLMRQGKMAEAIFHIEHALSLRPDMFEAYGNLCQAYMWSGQRDRAIEAACRVLELRETPQSKAMFAQCVSFMRFAADNGRYRKFVLRALVEGWVRPRELAGVSISLIKLNGAVKDAIARAGAAWPTRPPLNEPFGGVDTTALAQDELLCRLLECDPITDVSLERLLTDVRYALLKAASADVMPEDAPLGFYCALARQCFINEYVFATTDDEAEEARHLRAALEQKLVRRALPAPLAGRRRRILPAPHFGECTGTARPRCATEYRRSTRPTSRRTGGRETPRRRHPRSHRNQRRSIERGTPAIRREPVPALDQARTGSATRRALRSA